MRALLLILIASSALGQGRFDRFNQRTDQGRSTRGFEQSSYAFFEFAPASGAGMGTACACTTPTGAKGEALTFTRAGDATCSKQGLATTGIANGDLVACTANQPRVESSGGVLGLRVEGARTNALLRFIDYANATWADVATPTLTGSQTSPFTGALASSAVQFDDNDGAAFEGRTQTVTVTAATAYTMSCYVKAGTLASWTLSLDGTTASGTGLSSTTWSLVTVADASSSGVAIAAQALNGSTAAATGTVIWGGCQVEAGAYATSMIPTVAAAVTRNADVPYFALTGPGLSVGSMAATVQVAPSASFPYALTASTANPPPGSGFDQFALYSNGTAGATWACFVGANAAVYATGSVVPGAGTSRRGWCSAGGAGGVVNGAVNGVSMTASGAIAGPFGAENFLFVGTINNALTAVDSIVSRVCRDPDPTRCR